MGDNHLLLAILGVLAILLVVAIAAVSIVGATPHSTLTGALGAVLGAIIALAQQPRRDKQ